MIVRPVEDETARADPPGGLGGEGIRAVHVAQIEAGAVGFRAAGPASCARTENSCSQYYLLSRWDAPAATDHVVGDFAEAVR